MTNWEHSNQYSADSACEHCAGIVSHETWCLVRNAAVAYAFTIVTKPVYISQADHYALHGMGVSWEQSSTNLTKGTDDI